MVSLKGCPLSLEVSGLAGSNWDGWEKGKRAISIAETKYKSMHPTLGCILRVPLSVASWLCGFIDHLVY
jgi:hypothetical protein